MTNIRMLAVALLLSAAFGCATNASRADRIPDPQTCEGLMGQAKVDCENTFGGVAR